MGSHGSRLLQGGRPVQLGLPQGTCWWNRKGTGQVRSRLTTSDVLPSARLHLLKAPQPPKTAPPAGHQVFKHRSLCGTPRIQDTVLNSHPGPRKSSVSEESYEQHHGLVLQRRKQILRGLESVGAGGFLASPS